MYFYLNHPIRYITIVGLVVEVDHINRYTLITLDDGSGACIQLKITRNVDKDRLEKTATEKVTVQTSDGEYMILLGIQRIDIGVIIKAKGTISFYRERQMELKRVSIVKDTAEEVAAWKDTAEFKTDVLSEPWVLTDEERKNVDARLAAEEKQEREEEEKFRESQDRKRRKHQMKEVQLAQKRAEYRRKLARHEMRVEQRRQIAEKEMNAGALI